MKKIIILISTSIFIIIPINIAKAQFALPNTFYLFCQCTSPQNPDQKACFGLDEGKLYKDNNLGSAIVEARKNTLEAINQLKEEGIEISEERIEAEFEKGYSPSVKEKAKELCSVYYPGWQCEISYDEKECMANQNIPTVVDVTKRGVDLSFLNNLNLNTTIPGFKPSNISKDLVADQMGYIYIPWTAELISALYRFGVLIASVLGIIMIIIYGLQIIISGGGEKKMSAYKNIGRVAIGLGLAWSSYLILYTINPNLVNLDNLKVKVAKLAEREIYIDNGSDRTDYKLPEPQPRCPSTADMLQVDPKDFPENSLILVGPAEIYPFIHKDAYKALKTATEEAEKQGKTLVIKTLARNFDAQKNLFDEALHTNLNNIEKARKLVAPANCGAPHLTGRAIDVCLFPGDSCSFIKNTYATSYDNINVFNEIKILFALMKQTGWNRYCNEWWHFEFGLNGYDDRDYGNKECKPLEKTGVLKTKEAIRKEAGSYNSQSDVNQASQY